MSNEQTFAFAAFARHSRSDLQVQSIMRSIFPKTGRPVDRSRPVSGDALGARGANSPPSRAPIVLRTERSTR